MLLVVSWKQSLSAPQVLPQVEPLQRYGAQLDVDAVAQLPAPEQNAGAVKVLPLQEAAAQPTEVEACVQAPRPLQVPVFPQVPLAEQRACGSLMLAATLAQAPALPATLQAWQVGQLAVPQQTPSTQKPLLHSWLAMQPRPLLLTGRQLPLVPVQ
jgi:hypothetical protein